MNNSETLQELAEQVGRVLEDVLETYGYGTKGPVMRPTTKARLIRLLMKNVDLENHPYRIAAIESGAERMITDERFWSFSRLWELCREEYLGMPPRKSTGPVPTATAEDCARYADM